ncbi:MAG: transglutaminase-like domain-containing protein [Anaerovoracaceae bacterium]|nr:transglutaminase-like domain-containing protein [Anaerovoracaceae bacterium]
MKIRKPAFLIALALCLVTALFVPQAALTAEAASVVNISSAAGLAKALTDSKSATCRLTDDISGIKGQITVKSGTKTIDLNGHTIKGSSTTSLIYVNGGRLTVKSSASGGMIYNTNSSGDAAGCGKGRLEISSAALQGKSYGIYQDGGTVSITGGSIKATGKYGIAMYMTGSDKATAVISGGSFTGTRQALTMDRGKCTVKGGTFTGRQSTAINISPLTGKAVFSMTGGKAVCKVKESAALGAQNRTDLSITGGTFINEKGGYQLQIFDTFSGKKEIAEGIFDKDSVYDDTPEGKGLIATSFKRNDTKYKAGMTVTDPDDLYSMHMNACENLETNIRFCCSEKLYDVFAYYAADWSEGMTKNHNVEGNITDGDATVTAKVSYMLRYKVDALGRNPQLASKAGDTAVKYSNQMNTILKKTVKSGMTAKEKARAVHDYMIKNYSYDYAAAKNPSKYPASYDFYGLLKNKKGVCQSFALLYAMLMNRAGVDCGTVSGVAAGSAGGSDYEAHMWNVIKLKSGSRYYVDVTFDEGASSGSKVSTRFFYKSKSKFYGLKYHIAY